MYLDETVSGACWLDRTLTSVELPKSTMAAKSTKAVRTRACTGRKGAVARGRQYERLRGEEDSRDLRTGVKWGAEGGAWESGIVWE